ncbi:C1 family peptidase [Actinomyces bouchesdurhonensis]|uniref:aminopeptidase C n=1 Tax=Actinomyces bouchesdurhonensis TaxID=1852361 RepID=UPI0028E4EFEF|nr:C1 family peptidase [Actinomyces bouchesdurhonensis]
MAHEITDELIDRLHAYSDTARTVARNAVAHAGVESVAVDRDKVVGTPTVVSHKVDDWTVTSQKKSGRCWLFSSLNLLRSTTRTHLGLKNFEFSQNYVLFWDKFERANFFLTSVISTATTEKLDGRLLQFLLGDVLSDGGQWDMAVSLYLKHGLVPKVAMPETESSGHTAPMNARLKVLLRRTALELRALVAEGACEEEINEVKDAALADVWRILVICLGEPPASFEWEWRDDAGEFHRDGILTPREFYERYVDVDLTQYVCLVDDPRTCHPKGQTLTVDYMGNVVGGRPILYVNAPIRQIRAITTSVLTSGRAVWFGADCHPNSDRASGLFVDGLYDFDNLFGVDFSTSKEQRVDTGESAMNHAMLFTGVDVNEAGEGRRFRVENSWSEEPGDKGFFTMDAPWFDANVFEVAVHVDDLPAELRAVISEEPTHLPAWDPMGALA